MSALPEIVPSLVDHIKQTLVGLKMPRAIEIFDVIVRRLERGEITAIEAIDVLLAEELTLRENRRIKIALVMARLSTIKTLAGFDMLHVPYKSNPLAVADLLGGQISLVFADLSTTLPQIRGGRVKGFGVSSAERSPLAPELPTMIEEGVPGYTLTAWFAAFVPAKSDKAVVGKLNAALNAALTDKAVRDALLAAGIEPVTSSPEELRAYVAAETRKWADIVRAAGIQPE